MTISFVAHKKKTGAVYALNVTNKHAQLLKELSYYPTQGRTDSELTFGLRMHQAGARRCELRDIGAVRDRGKRSNSGAICWHLTQTGYDLLHRIENEAKHETKEAVSA